MAYSDFTLEKVKQKFQINTIEKNDIAGIPAIYKRVQLFLNFAPAKLKIQKSHTQTPKNNSTSGCFCVRFPTKLLFNRLSYFNHRAASLAW